jgi:FkbM family methyltransferase
VTVSDAQERMEALAQRLRHYDPSQLYFQVAEIAGEQTYLRHGVRVSEGDVVVDVGANVGVAAVFFASQCGAGLVHSFEPVSPVFELLRENVRDLPACVVHNQGLAAAPGRVPITFYPGAAAMSGLYADPKRDRALVRTALLNAGLSGDEAEEQLEGRYEAQTVMCELRTVSSFLREEGLDRVHLLKIDVERAELDVLAGIDDGDWPKIEQTAIEVHDEGGRATAIADALTGRGFRVTIEQDARMRGTSVRMLYATRQPEPRR